MKPGKKERRFWKTKFTFKNITSIPSEMDHLNLRDENFTNEELCYITSRIRRIDRLDLDNNPIDDEGLVCLENLEYIRELRLKSMNITDASVESLCEMQDLELLHLGSTKVSCEGVRKLSPLKNLKTLIVSPPEIGESSLNYFLEEVPGCELIINYKPYRN
ncbi:hypothetical protein NE848_11495 [Gramella jeungdoensis]|uniref:Leucine-rich repeat domain-containing protein n=1 Tax=Gramella jeungdoensis TaxID=708091 RepID=A0ABT0Z2Q9_9FLAO|nr:hypothetical protein [Gramella jeungdoensis]MCM8570007.1 hypothetical protein [Gramella jeungdoensis]